MTRYDEPIDIHASDSDSATATYGLHGFRWRDTPHVIDRVSTLTVIPGDPPGSQTARTTWWVQAHTGDQPPGTYELIDTPTGWRVHHAWTISPPPPPLAVRDRTVDPGTLEPPGLER